MEDLRSCGSVMRIFPENCDINILDNGRTVRDFIDNKIKDLASKDTEEPFYVANLDSLLVMHHKWVTNLPRVQPFYALKCNNTPVVLRMLSALGTGFDCASKGELQLALSLGVTPDKIIYAHTAKPLEHIKYAFAHGVNMMTFDNEDELLKISHCTDKAKLVLRIAVDDSTSTFRLSMKFGAKLEAAGMLLNRAAELGLEVIGVSFHAGSSCTSSLPFKQAIADARHVFDVANMLGFKLSLLDIGGGFPGRDDLEPKFQEFAEVINEALDEFFPLDSGVQIMAEPGRYYVETTFTLVANVFAKKIVTDDRNGDGDGEKDGTDRVMVYYLNDGVYGSMNCYLHYTDKADIIPYIHRAVESHERKYRSIIWGPTCDSTDKLLDNFWIPELHIGDWLLFENMGAYSVTLCSGFNGFEKAQIHPVLTAETMISIREMDKVLPIPPTAQK